MLASTQRLIAFLTCCVLAACTPMTTDTRLTGDTEPSIAILTTGTPGFALPVKATVVFSAKSQALLANEGAVRAVTHMVNTELVNALATVNVATSNDLRQADVAVTWVLAGARRIDDAAFANEFGMMPGLVVSDPQATKGTLMVALSNPATGEVLWRGAAQGAVSESADLVEVENRVRDIAQRMVRAIPRRN